MLSPPIETFDPWAMSDIARNWYLPFSLPVTMTKPETSFVFFIAQCFNEQFQFIHMANFISNYIKCNSEFI